MQVPLPTRTPTASALPAASSRYSNGCNALPNRNFSSSTVSLARHLQRSTTANRVALVDSPVQSEPREEPPKRYVLGELLGAGTAGSVFCATETQSGLQYAVKQISKAKGSRDRTRLVQKEVELSKILGDCRHAVQLLDTFEDNRNIYVVLELLTGGDLADLMTAQEGRLSEYEVATIMKCVLEFLVDCHQRHICYGDIKPNNFVLRSLYPSIRHLLDPSKPKGNLEVVAVDFGCCQVMRDEQCIADAQITGTPLYMAPENLRGCHGLEVDVWAAGVMLYQLLSDRFPFWDLDLHQLADLGGGSIRDGILYGPVMFPLHPWNTDVHPSAQDLILKMLERNPEKRLTAKAALQHPWFEHALNVPSFY